MSPPPADMSMALRAACGGTAPSLFLGVIRDDCSERRLILKEVDMVRVVC